MATLIDVRRRPSLSRSLPIVHRRLPTRFRPILSAFRSDHRVEPEGTAEGDRPGGRPQSHGHRAGRGGVFLEPGELGPIPGDQSANQADE